ncbi:uncharacterized protein MYCFIDRAFT_210699 [Pseudocercospora fijiensis CIRAD86]|uniref:Mid2 domain-containing protein n=1 Tax=Pseudocercospora fijiensis (strain CIRAD86) TaxID=383855 RepID=M2ZXV0_PSEFD|nr:uncharacterized protein MYCFIDRAFT_210699 [Pseudocercospora fijiensis CIRAD86]EME83764.1 hypothetical protein MYCFIDRAFT_210699 [Pseudocercospora fijiensis CIRAD86]
MRPQTPSVAATMFSFFAQIRADSIPDGILPKNKRQVVGTGVTTTTTMASTSDTPSSTTEPTSETTPTTTQPTSEETTPTSAQTTSAETTPTSTVPTTIDVTTTNSDGSTVTSRIATRTAVSGSASTGLVKTTSGKSSDIVVVGSSTINRSTLSSATVITSALVASETHRSTYTSFWTSDGSVYSSLVTTDQVVASTTGYATATISPSLADSSSGGSSLSTSSKKIIGGVVGGIGGAILVGGLAVVAWRIWGRKKRPAVPQDEYLDSQNDSIRKERIASGSGLERYQQPHNAPYHNPGGSVNTASNF